LTKTKRFGRAREGLVNVGLPGEGTFLYDRLPVPEWGQEISHFVTVSPFDYIGCA